ncbi:MAG: ATP-dependent sacrificial sulfur transferase LarE [Acidobacteriota bacterium]
MERTVESAMRLSRSSGDGVVDEKYESLVKIIRDLESVVVGFSGGVDSTLLLKVAVDHLGDKALAITAFSPSYPERDRREAVRMARLIGARHELVDSSEFEDPSYVANSTKRCFFCKQELFDILWKTARREGLAAVAYGAITDDEGDFRPGMQAAREAGARAPLLESGLCKIDVRKISRRLGLPAWDRPASACLSSRIPHGTPIDPIVLGRVERCEDFLMANGLGQVRVRSHGEVARIECTAEDIPRFAETGFRRRLTDRFKQLGFRFVTLDLEGYRTGSLNPPVAVRKK